ASFVGSSNQFRGVLESASQGLCRVDNQLLHVLPTPELKDGEAVLVLVRPEEVSLVSLQEANEQNDVSTPTDENMIAGVIELRTFLGPFTRFHVRTDAGNSLTADIPSQQARGNFVAQRVLLTFSPTVCQVLPLDSQEAKLTKQAEAEAV
ncbi:MAG: TOBE domain-containing protein, partial [Ktedonobacteraceae bacterium]